jgi:succinate dehydrogenase/fumarate reductase cytochrome b subunit
MNKADKTQRGAFKSYLVSLVVYCLSVILLIRIYIGMDPILMDMWGSRYASYIVEYRNLAGKIWRMLYRCTSSWLFILLPIMWALATYLIQSGLKKEVANKFNIIHTILNIVIFSILFVLMMTLMFRPLI